MAKAASKASKFTTLTVGAVEVAVGLFPARAKSGALAEFDTAGPSGGVLQAQAVARPTPVSEEVDVPEQPVHSDPLSDAPLASPERDALAAELDDGPPVELLAASSPQVDGEYGRELVEEGTGEVVLPQNVRRGVRLEDGRFIDCTDELAKIAEQTRLDRMEVVSFVDVTRVPRARTVGAYYVGVADEKAAKPLRLIFEALRSTRRAAVVKLTKRTRQSLGVVVASNKTLMLMELVWAEDHREPPARALAIQKAHVSDREVAQACKLVNAMSDSMESLNELRDDALALREELRAKALRGEVAEVIVPKAVQDEQDDVMAQLEASLAAVA